MFLKHLKWKIEHADTDDADTNNCTVGPDGVTRRHEYLWTKILHPLKVVPSCQLHVHVGYTAQVSTIVALAYTYWN